MSVGKKRLDVLVFERGLTKSREEAKRLIMSGEVFVENQKSDKPGTTYKEDVEIRVNEKKNPYVSRGGLKLEKALKSFNITLDDKIVMDIGASTGGFTDCMLKNGAAKVYSIDVGYGQLAWKLRNNSKVVNLERTNFRYIDPEKIKDKIDFFSVDVSFISLELILPVAINFLNDESTAVCLIKPQFEAGRKDVGKNGVVRDCNVQIRVVEKIIEFSIKTGFSVLSLDFSPVRGPQGNIEFLLYLQKSCSPENLLTYNVSEVVGRANNCLK